MNWLGWLVVVCAHLVTSRADDTLALDRLPTNLTDSLLPGANEDSIIPVSDLSFHGDPVIKFGSNHSSRAGFPYDGVLASSSAVFPGVRRNRTVDNVGDVGAFDVLGLWDRLPKVITPRGGSERCRNESQLYLRALENFDLWALKMFDATAKAPSGILSGNVNQYGDFDECLSVGVDGSEEHVQGQYCLASVQYTHKLALVDALIHAHYYIRSNLTDLGHRVPRFSSMVWGVCLPSSCTPRDLEQELLIHLEGSGAMVKVHDNMCTKRGRKIAPPVGRLLALTFFFGILSLVAMGTVFDDGSEGSTTFSKVLNAFSLRRNARSLLDMKESSKELPGVSGVRCLSALGLLMAHKSMALTHVPFVNRTQMAESLSEPWTVVGRTAIIYTDTFLYISGLLNAHNLFKELDRSGTIEFKSRVLSRWFRLFPLFLSVMLFCTYILPDLNNGPQWNLVVEEHSRACQATMWRSLLFIHNFFGFENMCLTHTHQLGIDMQLYLATPLFVWLLWRSPRLGWLLLLASAALSTVLRYLAVYRHNISMVVYFGISVQNLMDAAKYSYILPTHRATIYLIGVTMAYVLMSKWSQFQINKAQTYLLWTTAAILGLWALASPWRMGLKTYVFEHGPAAVYSAVSPIVWGGFLALAHWAISNDHGGWFTRFLNCRLFRFLNKISYGVYLTQFPLYFYSVGVQRNPAYYSTLHIFYLPEIAAILGLSIFTTLVIEMPFNEIHRHFFSKSKVRDNKVKVK